MLAQSPARTVPTESGLARSRCASSGCGSRLRDTSSACKASWINTNFSIALTPRLRVEPCVASPGTSSRKVSDPALAGITDPAVGSAIRHASPPCPRRSVANVPAPPSSSPITVCTASGFRNRMPAATIAATAPRIAATPPFMSHVPRPHITPSSTRAENGSPPGHTPPGGTTSTCPLRISPGVPSPPSTPTHPHASSRATSMPGNSGSALNARRSIGQLSTIRPSAESRCAHHACTSLSAGVPSTLGIRTNSRSSSTTRWSSTAARTARSTSLNMRTSCTSHCCPRPALLRHAAPRSSACAP